MNGVLNLEELITGEKYYLVHHKVKQDDGRLSCRMLKAKLEHVDVRSDEKYNALFCTKGNNVVSSQFYYVFKSPVDAVELMKQAITHGKTTDRYASTER